MGFIQTSWEFCDDRSNKGCRALGVTSKRMKTASLGLLEVMVVRANARSNDMIIKLKCFMRSGFQEVTTVYNIINWT